MFSESLVNTLTTKNFGGKKFRRKSSPKFFPAEYYSAKIFKFSPKFFPPKFFPPKFFRRNFWLLMYENKFGKRKYQKGMGELTVYFDQLLTKIGHLITTPFDAPYFYISTNNPCIKETFISQ